MTEPAHKGPPSHVVAKWVLDMETLRIRLHEAFSGRQPGETSERRRERYIDAIVALGDFAFDTLGDKEVATELQHLALALSDLDNGTVHHFLTKSSGGTKRRDTSELWKLRAEVCLAFRFLVLNGEETPMPSLSNPRHERFAQELASGKSATEAYAAAGYRESRSAACRLSTNVNVERRVAELQERGAIRAEITVERLTDMLLADRDLARQIGQASAAVAAVEKIGKLHGLFVERRENTNVHHVVSPQMPTPEEWEAEYCTEHTEH